MRYVTIDDEPRYRVDLGMPPGLLDRGLSDRKVAERRGLSPATVKDHKRRILEILGAEPDTARRGYAGLVREMGVGPGDLVNHAPGSRTARGLIRRATARLRRPRSREAPPREPALRDRGLCRSTRPGPVPRAKYRVSVVVAGC